MKFKKIAHVAVFMLITQIILCKNVSGMYLKYLEYFSQKLGLQKLESCMIIMECM